MSRFSARTMSLWAVLDGGLDEGFSEGGVARGGRRRVDAEVQRAPDVFGGCARGGAGGGARGGARPARRRGRGGRAREARRREDGRCKAGADDARCAGGRRVQG